MTSDDISVWDFWWREGKSQVIVSKDYCNKQRRCSTVRQIQAVHMLAKCLLDDRHGITFEDHLCRTENYRVVRNFFVVRRSQHQTCLKFLNLKSGKNPHRQLMSWRSDCQQQKWLNEVFLYSMFVWSFRALLLSKGDLRRSRFRKWLERATRNSVIKL